VKRTESLSNSIFAGPSSHELTGEGALEDGLAQSCGALEVGGDEAFELVEDAEAAVDFGDDAGLLGERRKREWRLANELEVTAVSAVLEAELPELKP
jgi:hypothetical protein